MIETQISDYITSSPYIAETQIGDYLIINNATSVSTMCSKTVLIIVWEDHCMQFVSSTVIFNTMMFCL